MKKSLSLLLATLLLASATSCGESTNDDTRLPEETTPAETTESIHPVTDVEPETEPAYLYPELDMKGGDFHILNQAATSWNYISVYDTEEMSGDKLEDAVYERNRFIENQFDLKLVVTDKELADAANHLRTTITAQEDLYQYAYVMGYYLGTVIGADYLIDLETVPGLDLDKPWWDPDRAEYTVGKTYFVEDSSSLLGFNGTFCVFFNKQLFTDKQLGNPYDLVREGKWTLDEVGRIIENGASLNGDDEYTDSSPNATFGLMGWVANGYVDLYVGSDVTLVTVVDGQPVYTAGTEHAINAFEKVAQITSLPGFIDGSYPTHFANGRSVMTLGQIKEAVLYRDMEDDFGVLPPPKYDEAQENYSAYTTGCPFMIPITNTDLETTAIVADAMGYYSSVNVIPELMDGLLSHKSMRDTDSIEMLNIIRDSATMDLGIIYGWATDVQGVIVDKIIEGGRNLASSVERYRTRTENAIKSYMEKIAE